MYLRFGLLVPCFNASNYVEDFIKNLDAQELKFDEVIFYDDASKDNTANLIESYGYKVIRGEVNRGPSYARNKLAEATVCNWFHFHDIDDFMAPSYLAKVSSIVRTRQYDVVLCNVDWLSSNKDRVELSWHYSNEEIQKHPLKYTITHPIGGINGCYSREIFDKIKGFDESVKLWEDADLHVRLAEANARFFIIEEVLSYAVRHENSLSSKQKDAWISRYKLLKSYFETFSTTDIRKYLGIEAQRAASSLVIYKELRLAEESLRLSEDCGVQVPNNRNFIWKILKKIIPKDGRIKLRIFQLQHAFRNHG